ncbi:tRNA pseudouridine(55) synthase TruB [Leeia sp. TBRC 13508]|uniref:tRNA pseudouridine synthase B n=1 Tax=Leeia speluncae TaxID=2884804 RepID=A0ABS8D1E2_9NEIS|nr:tRNA pseudouridine(55) synthase TruB [Leeia speluncae]MCB6182011.1 tRNA pseudouridine(55) synthase TruB [Leeia speluncae]
MKRKIDGVLLIDKPYGWSSNKALMKTRWLLQAQKAGHTGVLDPLATGLLPICFGEATKYAQRWLDADKGYLATISLGQTMTTGDLEGEVLEIKPVTCTEADVHRVLSQFLGQISQVPPLYSALKHQGKPLYEYARAGQEIERQARTITIYELQLISCQLPVLEVAVRCSKGAYIRTLAEDIGKALGCGAHLSALRRTGTGGFDLSSSYTIEAVEALDMDAREALLLPVDLLLGDLPQLILPAAESIKLSHGQAVRHNGQPGQQRVYNPEGKFIGLGEIREGTLYPARMMGNA